MKRLMSPVLTFAVMVMMLTGTVSSSHATDKRFKILFVDDEQINIHVAEQDQAHTQPNSGL